MLYVVATNDNKELVRDFETQEIHYFETKSAAETYVKVCNQYSKIGFKVIETREKFIDKLYKRK